MLELELVNVLFSWLTHVGSACIVCNWDPASQSWVPYAGTAAAGAAGAAAGTAAGQAGGRGAGGSGSPGLGQPVNPDTYQRLPPGHAPAVPSEYIPRDDVDARVAGDEAAREQARADRHARHPEDTPAPPPNQPDHSAGDAFYHTVFTLGTR